MFISEILSPECVVLGTETDLRKKMCPVICSVLWSPKYAKIDKSLFYAYFWHVLLVLTPLYVLGSDSYCSFWHNLTTEFGHFEPSTSFDYIPFLAL